MDNKQLVNSIKIIDYGVLFELSITLMVVAVAIPLIVIDIKNILSSGLYYGFESLRVFALILIMMWMIYIFFVRNPKKFYNDKSYFLFSNDAIEYHHPETYATESVNFTIPLDEIQYIDYCIVTELHNRYGRLHHLTAWQLYRKSSIGVHIGKATLFLYYSIIYLVLAFPYRIWCLFKSRESIELLNQNLFISFKNRNYFVVNIYSKKEFDELIKYFSNNKIPIRGKTHFIPHLQNQGWFVDKEEKWTNNLDKVSI